MRIIGQGNGTLGTLLVLVGLLLGGCTLGTGASPLPTLIPTAVSLADYPPVVAIAVTFTPIPTLEQTATPGPTPTPGPSHTPTSDPTATPRASATPSPTSRPQFVATLPPIGNGPAAEITGTPPPIPTAVPTFALPESVTNILLLGSDTLDADTGVSRTDSIIVVSINREARTAAMLSIPRDLWVYIPTWQMNRINTAVGRGESADYPGGGIDRLRATILYNLGIPIHYYAQVDFGGFKQMVDAIGGVDVAVSCPLRDWRLISPELDITVEENYEQFTLDQGVQYMDGDLALWYARSRVTTSDFDRGRRQQQLLRAMLDQGLRLNLIPQVPIFWSTYRDSVETDIDIGRLLQLASLAPDIRENGLQHLTLAGGNVIPYTIPETGAEVQLPNWPVMEATLQQLFLPPALNSGSRPPLTVEIINASGQPGMDVLAADNLDWYGFDPIIGAPHSTTQQATEITYFGANMKGSFDWLMAWVFRQYRSQILLDSETPTVVDYRIILGEDYNPCRPQQYAPLP